MIRIETDNKAASSALAMAHNNAEPVELFGQVFMPHSAGVSVTASGSVSSFELIDVARKPWDGEGKPPLGIEVEALIFNSLGQQEWVKAKVIHHCRDSAAIAHGLEFGLVCWPASVRPIKTAEQLKAEERERGITALRIVAPGIAWNSAAKLYDAGARVEA